VSQTVDDVMAARPHQRSRVVRSLSPADRFWWAVGSPARLIGLLVVMFLLMWLGYISIGFSAIVVLGLLVGMAHLMPYMWSARLRLVVDQYGVYDIRRFRRRVYLWSDGYLLYENGTKAQQFRGLEICSDGPDTAPRVLLASWCKSSHDLDLLIASIRAAGYDVDFLSDED
jgi:hypothetical protein